MNSNLSFRITQLFPPQKRVNAPIVRAFQQKAERDKKIHQSQLLSAERIAQMNAEHGDEHRENDKKARRTREKSEREKRAA